MRKNLRSAHLVHVTSVLILIASLFCLASPNAFAVKRIVLIGDSWTQWPWKMGSFQDVLNYWWPGNQYQVEGTYTAIGGSAAQMWASNADPGTGTFPTWDGQPHGLLDRLDYTLDTNPTIDIVHMSLGGIDMLATWRNGMQGTQQETDLFNSIYNNVQTVVNHILTRYPSRNMKILWVDYDFLNITETCTYGMSEFSWEAVYSATALGFTVGDFNQNAANNREINHAFGRCALRKIDFANLVFRVDYIQNFGNIQWRAGYDNSIHIPFWNPGAVPAPGWAPSYSPLPGGNPNYGTPPVFMDTPEDT